MKNGTRNWSRSRAAGFTLVELMVVVAIVAILASIAYPGYRSHVVKTKRAAAKACLSQYSALYERFYTTSITYVGGPAPPACASEGNMEDNYLFTPSGVTATAYSLRATPTPAFAERDTECGTLMLNQLGVKSVSTGTVDRCW